MHDKYYINIGKVDLGNLSDVTRTHSVIVNDHLDTINPRAILMWSTEKSYSDIKQSLT